MQPYFLANSPAIMLLAALLTVPAACAKQNYSEKQRDDAWKFIIETQKAGGSPAAGADREHIRGHLVGIVQESCANGPPCDGLQVSQALSLLAESVDRDEAVRLSKQILKKSNAPTDALFVAGKVLTEYDPNHSIHLLVEALRLRPDQFGAIISPMETSLLFDNPRECREAFEILVENRASGTVSGKYLDAKIKTLQTCGSEAK